MKCKIYLLFVIVLFSMRVVSQTETCLDNQNDPDLRMITQVVNSDTLHREYILHIPEDYNENKPAPLVINMHGFGDCASRYAKTINDFYDFSTMANEENIIVAYPQGAYRKEKEDTYWEPGDNMEYNIVKNDVLFIEKLVEKLHLEYNLNSDMIYACGYSNGGMMAYSLACNLSDRFSAIGVMSGTMLEEDCTLTRTVPIIKFHGISDDVLPYQGNFWYQSVDDVVNFWLDKNGIPSSSLVTAQLKNGDVIHDHYSGGRGNACLSLYTINYEYNKPGGHVWFSDRIEGLTPNRLMWDFFKMNCGIVSSVDDTSDENYFISPNPVQFDLTIELAGSQEYQLYDCNGRMMLAGELMTNSEVISLAHFNSGIYILKVGQQVQKIFKIE